MATFVKKENGWLVRFRQKGINESAQFHTKAECQAWVTNLEIELSNKRLGKIPDKTFGDLLRRYMLEVSVGKDGSRWEEIRIKKFLGEGKDPEPLKITKIKLDDLDSSHVGEWRDDRLKQVSNSSVSREWNLMSAACTRAKKEWKWLKENPFQSATKPKPAPPRNRLPTANEIELICHVCGYRDSVKPVAEQARVAAAFLFCIETGLRAGELCALMWADVDLDRMVLKVKAIELGARKTGLSREVPISHEAKKILDNLTGIDEVSVFKINSSNLDALFRKAKTRAMIDGLHFHDSRAEALTRLSKKVDPFELAKISGHKDLNMILNVYYRKDMADVARKINLPDSRQPASEKSI